MEARNKPEWLKTGVMSLNTMPFFGKSGTSRTAARSLSMISEAIGANASGLQLNVNHDTVRWIPCAFACFFGGSRHPGLLARKITSDYGCDRRTAMAARVSPMTPRYIVQ